MTQRWGIVPAVFSAKCFLAAMVAYWIALRIGLTHPYWAVTTSYIVAQPLSGAVASKAVFRLGGTVLGAAAAVVLVPALVNAPELLSLGLALWLGLCLYISLQDSTPRSYLFRLAGYTAAIIGFAGVGAPGAIFDLAILRVQEITLGILCATLVHAVILPQTVTRQLLARVDAILTDVDRWTGDALGNAGDAVLDRDRRRLALDIGELHTLSIHLPFDSARLLPRVRTVRAFQDQLSLILPLASAVDDRMAQLRATGPLPAPIAALVARVRTWLETPPLVPADRAAFVADFLADARAAEPDARAPLDWRDALQLSLVARLEELVLAHQAARDLRDQLRSARRIAVSPAAAAALGNVSRRSFHRDRAAALRTAAGTIATILVGCAFWIGTGWSEGGGAVLIAGVVCALFGASDNPRPTILTFLWGTMIGIGLAAVYAYAILPRVTDFVTLVAVLAPTLLLAGSLFARPSLNLITLGALLGLLNQVGLNDSYGGDLASFANGAVAQVIGTAFAVLTVGLFQSVGAERSAARIVTAGWRDLARRSNLPGRPDTRAWISRMLDRIGLLAPRLAAMGDDPARPVLDALQDLRVGVMVGRLRELRIDADAAPAARITPILAGVSAYYARRRTDRPAPVDAELLRDIDAGLDAFSAEPDAPLRREGVLALTSLRRNLFPAAAPFVPPTALTVPAPVPTAVPA